MDQVCIDLSSSEDEIDEEDLKKYNSAWENEEFGIHGDLFGDGAIPAHLLNPNPPPQQNLNAANQNGANGNAVINLDSESSQNSQRSNGNSEPSEPEPAAPESEPDSGDIDLTGEDVDHEGAYHFLSHEV